MDDIATPQPFHGALAVEIGLAEQHRAQLSEGLLAEEPRARIRSRSRMQGAARRPRAAPSA